jgi:hypothetical protein
MNKPTLCFWLAFCVSTVGAQTFNAALGTLPQEQGFPYSGDGANPTPYILNGALEENTTAGGQSWSIAPVDFSQHSVLQANLHIISSNYVPNVGTGTREGYYLILEDISGTSFAIGLASAGFNINTITVPNHPLTPYPAPVTDGFHLFRLDVSKSVGTFSIDGAVVASNIPAGPFEQASGGFGGAAGASVSDTELRSLLVQGGSCGGTEVTGSIKITKGPFIADPLGNFYTQETMFANTSGSAISGPLFLVLEGLPRVDDTICQNGCNVQPSVTVFCTSAHVSTATVEISATGLAAGESVTEKLLFVPGSSTAGSPIDKFAYKGRFFTGQP